MKSVLTFPARLIAFWLLFFAIFRLWFVLWFYAEWSPETPWSAWYSFWHALPLDLSMAGYLLVIPVLVWFAGWAFKAIRARAEKAITWYNILIFSVFVFVYGANIFLYQEWHTPLNNRALEYFKTPAALLDSMSLGFKIVCVVLYFGGVWLVYKGYKAVVGLKLYPENTPRKVLFALPFLLGLLLLAMRGGVGVMAINESAVYYSSNLFDNHAAINTSWHVLHSMIETRSTENHFLFMPAQTASAESLGLRTAAGPAPDVREQLLGKTDSVPLNLFFIIMESETAQVIEELGGEKGVCPNIGRLAREGMLFTNCYGSGYRTDQGIVSVLAGYPAQPDQSIVLLDDKASKLGSVPKTLKAKGYSTAFFYGGELTFANIGSWLTTQRFEKVFSEKDFGSADKTQRWGVDDVKLLQRTILEINQLRAPFFATAMTLSLHPPYDVPFKSQWQNNTDREKFLNSAAFADHAIGEFFKTAEKQPWYNNTLFVLVADHGASQPSGLGLDNPVTRHIPLIIFGKPLNAQSQGKKTDCFCNHHDIAATILPLLGLNDNAASFPWSRNLWAFQSAPNSKQTPTGFAYFSNENGLGWVNSEGKGFYYFGQKTWHIWEGQLDSMSQQQAKGYLQSAYQDFLDK